MRHPYGRCEGCGERLYQQVAGEYGCLNCGTTHPESYFGEDDSPSRSRDDGPTQFRR